ncbi:hypothetical protein FRC02_003152 [Tulasnella sp. 418]|nr:hypothetical protein FRC02_003152 [Tulasnella sp. 418]
MPLHEARSNTHSLDLSSIFRFKPPESMRPNVTFITSVTATGALSWSFTNLDVVNKFALPLNGGTGVDAGLDSAEGSDEDSAAGSDAGVRFGAVRSPFWLNPELNQRFGSPKGLNLGPNQPNWFNRFGSVRFRFEPIEPVFSE